MFTIGDRVRHKTTGIVGTVIGYGVRHIDSDRAITLKVELKSYDLVKPIAEDVRDKWKTCPKKVLACTLPHFPQRKLSKV